MARSFRKQQPRETVALVGDGQTERIYFSDVRDTDRPASLSIFPDYPRRFGSYKGVLERALTLTENYTSVYALIDTDKIVQENQQAAYRKDKAYAQAQGVIVLENHPCFEIWLLLHFVFTGRPVSQCAEIITELKRKDYLPTYDKSERYLKAARLYNTHKNLLVKVAIPNARRLEENRDQSDVFLPRAEIFKFFEWYFKKQ